MLRSRDELAVAVRHIAAAGETGLFRFLVVLTAFFVVCVGTITLQQSEVLIVLGCVAGVVVLVAAFRVDYLHPAVAFLVPWVVILLFSVTQISKYARPLEFGTCAFILTTIFIWLLVTCGPELSGNNGQTEAQAEASQGAEEPIPRIRAAVLGAFAALYAYAAFNVAYAGFVPLISLLTSGNSGYETFGIPSFYGAFLAYANALACLSLYQYLKTRDRVYLMLYLSVLSIHVLFVTRQNVVTLLVESFVIRCLTVRKFSRVSILLMFSVGLAAFSLLGNLRSGDIKQIIGVRESYAWVPDGFVWLYAYSYFNVLNVQNMMTLSGAPLFDGSMWHNLLPSVLRPQSEHASYLQLVALNVSSYIYPIYLDVGAWGVRLWTAFWGVVTALTYRAAIHRGRFADKAIYACLYFCALLSFFVDFWFYLPVIFQVVFFYTFQSAFYRKRPVRAAA